MSLPSTQMFPLLAESRPPKRFNNVDLPLPLFPKIKTMPLLGRVKETLSNALCLPFFFDLYILVKLVTLIIKIIPKYNLHIQVYQ